MVQPVAETLSFLDKTFMRPFAAQGTASRFHRRSSEAVVQTKYGFWDRGFGLEEHTCAELNHDVILRFLMDLRHKLERTLTAQARRRGSRVWALIANAVLAVRLAILLLDGTVRGPLIVVAPLLVSVPAALNVVSAAFKLRWGGLRDT